jgi:hypothetical protein
MACQSLILSNTEGSYLFVILYANIVYFLSTSGQPRRKRKVGKGIQSKLYKVKDVGHNQHVFTWCITQLTHAADPVRSSVKFGKNVLSDCITFVRQMHNVCEQLFVMFAKVTN